ncbi:MAG: hypothetical protein AAF587_33705 [Bacteroidota bacterium]
MAEFYFFTDVDLINDQSSKAFGPVPGEETSKFRTCSLHTASSNPPAYAICRGRPFVLPISDTNASGAPLVNVIFKPEPNESGVPLGVSYIIYKGILKSSLINGDTIADPTTSYIDLLTKVQDSETHRQEAQAALEESSTSESSEEDSSSEDESAESDSTSAPIELAPVEALTLGDSFSSDDTIDSVFYKKDRDIEPTVLTPGNIIGLFDKDRFGIEMICEGIGFQPTLEHALEVDSKIEVSPFDDTADFSSPAEIIRRAKMAEVRHFRDPAAFFGDFYERGLSLHSTISPSVSVVQETLYTTVIERFLNKNIVYIDIRNDANLAYNAYENYGPFSFIKIGLGAWRDKLDDIVPSLSTLVYDRNLEWGIFRMQASDIPSATNAEYVRLLLFLNRGDNTLPVGYVVHGNVTHPKNRNRKIDRRYNKYGLRYGRFFNLKHKAEEIELDDLAGETDDFTLPISLCIPCIKDQPSPTPVASYIRVNYAREWDPSQYPYDSVDLNIRDANFIDNLFAPFDLFFSDEEDTSRVRLKVFDERKYLYDGSFMESPSVFSIGVAEDQYNYTFFAFPTDKVNPDPEKEDLILPLEPHASRISKELIGMKDFSDPDDPPTTADIQDAFTKKINAYDDFRKFLALLSFNSYPRRSKLKFEGQNIPYYTFQVYDGSKDNANLDEWVILSITKSEYEEMRTTLLPQFHPDFRVYFGISVAYNEVDDKNRPFTCLDLVLRGYKEESGTIKVHKVNTGKQLYQYGD